MSAAGADVRGAVAVTDRVVPGSGGVGTVDYLLVALLATAFSLTDRLLRLGEAPTQAICSTLVPPFVTTCRLHLVACPRVTGIRELDSGSKNDEVDAEEDNYHRQGHEVVKA